MLHKIANLTSSEWEKHNEENFKDALYLRWYSRKWIFRISVARIRDSHVVGISNHLINIDFYW